MATFSQSDITSLFIGAAATKTTGAISTLNDGEIGLFTPAGTRLTEANAATEDEFIIVKGRGTGEIIYLSGVINKNDLVDASCNRVVYTAATQKVVTIGYDGSTGSITATNDNDYHVRINMREGRTSNHGGLYVKHGFYTSDASATQAEIVSELHKSLTNEFSKEPDSPVLVEALCNHAGTAIGTAADLAVGVAGSKSVVITDGSGASVLLEAGDFLRIGTGTTDEVYKIAEASKAATASGTIVLDVPLAADLSLAGNACEYITAAQAAAGNLGIRLTAVAGTHRIGKLHADLQNVDFDVTLQNFTESPVVATASSPGNGTQKQVQELEFFCQGNEGDFYRMGEPNLFDKRSEATGNYDLITLKSKSNYQGSIVSGPINKTYVLALPTTAPNYAVAGTADDITDVLEVLVWGSANGNFAIT
jgi:hypothetical protein